MYIPAWAIIIIVLFYLWRRSQNNKTQDYHELPKWIAIPAALVLLAFVFLIVSAVFGLVIALVASFKPYSDPGLMFIFVTTLMFFILSGGALVSSLLKKGITTKVYKAEDGSWHYATWREEKIGWQESSSFVSEAEAEEKLKEYIVQIQEGQYTKLTPIRYKEQPPSRHFSLNLKR